MSVIRYICAGDCRTMVTVEEFKQGKNTCKTETCEFFNKQLERGEYCSSCNTHFEEAEDHICF